MPSRNKKSIRRAKRKLRQAAEEAAFQLGNEKWQDSKPITGGPLEVSVKVEKKEYFEENKKSCTGILQLPTKKEIGGNMEDDCKLSVEGFDQKAIKDEPCEDLDEKAIKPVRIKVEKKEQFEPNKKSCVGILQLPKKEEINVNIENDCKPSVEDFDQKAIKEEYYEDLDDKAIKPVGGITPQDLMKRKFLSCQLNDVSKQVKSVLKSEETLNDLENRKLFVGGLHKAASDSDVGEFFTKFGIVENVNLKMDPVTGKSRGFGFITFNDESSVEKVLLAQSKASLSIMSKPIACKRTEAKQGKIYVKLPQIEISDNFIENYVARYGKIVEFERPVDKETGKKKTFCFFTFKHEETAKKLIKTGTISLVVEGQSHELVIKKVIKTNAASQYQGSSFPLPYGPPHFPYGPCYPLPNFCPPGFGYGWFPPVTQFKLGKHVHRHRNRPY